MTAAEAMASVECHVNPHWNNRLSEDTSSTPRYLPHHINIMKVALALAIIRQKPKGVSAREYAERLALQFSQVQLNWREKAQQLQQELLRTRQELTKFQIQAEGLVNTSGGSVQSSGSDWQSSGYSSTHTNSQELMVTENQVGSQTNSSKSNRISAHIKYLSSVSSVLRSRQHLSVLTESDLRSTVRDTVVSATRGLSEVLGASCLPVLPPSLDTLQTATRTIVEAIQAPRMKLFRAEMVEVCGTLLKSITTRISSHQDPTAQSEVLCGLVCTLSSVPDLYCQAVQQLIGAVLQCAQMLSSSTQDVCQLNVGTVETAATVFKTLEALFTKYDTSTLPLQTCVRLCGELEGSILEISDVYPLFTFLVWRVLAHLSPASR